MELVTPGIGLVFWMLLAFSVVFFVLAKFAWKPILKMIKDRENSIEDALKMADKAKEDMAQLQSDNERILAEARKERDLLLKEAREIKEKIIEDAKKQASIEGNKLIENAKSAIQNEKNAVLSDIKKQIAVLSIEIAEKILSKELSTDSKQVEYIDNLIKDIKLN